MRSPAPVRCCAAPLIAITLMALAIATAVGLWFGIEIERKYFDIACKRIENAQRQQRLFT